MRPDLAAPLRDVDSDVNWPPTRVASSQPDSEVVPPEAADPAQACNEGIAKVGFCRKPAFYLPVAGSRAPEMAL